MEARRRFGERLYVSSMAVVDEVSKGRAVHDATHGVGLSNRFATKSDTQELGISSAFGRS